MVKPCFLNNELVFSGSMPIIFKPQKLNSRGSDEHKLLSQR